MLPFFPARSPLKYGDDGVYDDVHTYAYLGPAHIFKEGGGSGTKRTLRAWGTTTKMICLSKRPTSGHPLGFSETV